MLELVLPSLERRLAWREAHREWGPGLHEDGFGIGPDDDVESLEGFGKWVAAGRRGPGNRWWIVEGESVLGGIALRAAGDERVSLLGHLGYGIRPSARSRGVATWAVGQALVRAGQLGIDPVFAVCHDDNRASIKTIEHWNGKLERTVAHGDARVRRYSLPALVRPASRVRGEGAGYPPARAPLLRAEHPGVSGSAPPPE